MTSILRGLKILVAIVLTYAVGTLPSCSTMGGGGGMKYLIDPLPDSSIVAYA
jgi:hypothetical protein